MREREFSGDVRVIQYPQQGMIAVRADMGAQFVQEAVADATGMPFPARGRCTFERSTHSAPSDQARGTAWMSVDEALMMAADNDVEPIRKQLEVSLNDHHAMVSDVSDMRSVFRVEGPLVREVLAKVSPVDLHPETFGPGYFRRTRLAQVAGAFWMMDETSFEVMCFRSVSDYVWNLLTVSATLGATPKIFPTPKKRPQPKEKP